MAPYQKYDFNALQAALDDVKNRRTRKRRIHYCLSSEEHRGTKKCTDWVCLYCNISFNSSRSGKWLDSDACQKWMHYKCVPETYKIATNLKKLISLKSLDYNRKLEEIVENGPYTKLKRDPTKSVENKIHQAVRVIKEDISGKSTQLTPTFCKAPHLYGLPKIHKEGFPLRIIVSGIGSPCQMLARFLLDIIKPVGGKSNSHIRNSQHLIEKLKDIKLEEREVLASFDICNLFPSVPKELAVEILKERLDRDSKLMDRTVLHVDKIIELINLCINSTYFQLGEDFYSQDNGLAMGSPLSPILADIFMEDLEQKSIDEYIGQKPKIWWRYVDDILLIWNFNTQDIKDFQSYMNSRNPAIKFTMEVEKDQKLLFLDVELERKTNGNVETSVYRKKTDSGRYLHYRSNHHKCVKLGVSNSLLLRAETHCSTRQAIEEEMTNVKRILKNNGYPEKEIRRLPPRNREEDSRGMERKMSMVIPYVKGLSESIRRIGNKVGVSTIFSSKDTIKNRLTRVKPKPLSNKNKEVVYKIKCQCGVSYIGETSRPMDIRCQEHRRMLEKARENMRRGESLNTILSHLAVHAAEKDHIVDWSETEVLAKESHWKRRKIHEAAAMLVTEEVISQPSVEIPLLWHSILKEERENVINEKKRRKHKEKVKLELQQKTYVADNSSLVLLNSNSQKVNMVQYRGRPRRERRAPKRLIEQ